MTFISDFYHDNHQFLCSRITEGSHSTESSGPGFGVNLAEIFDPGRGNRSESSAEDQEPSESFPFWTWTKTTTTSCGTSAKGVQLGKRILSLFVSYDGTEFVLLLQLFVLCCDLHRMQLNFKVNIRSKDNFEDQHKIFKAEANENIFQVHVTQLKTIVPCIVMLHAIQLLKCIACTIQS